jgi:uncharacterized protein with beta-barrel porin domain
MKYFTNIHRHLENIKLMATKRVTESCKNFQKKIGSNLKVSGDRRVTRSNFHTKATKILDTTLKNLVPKANWRPAFVHVKTKDVLGGGWHGGKT